MRPLCLFLFAAAAPALAPAAAQAQQAPYYGPMKAWQGIGYSDKLQKDGTWRIEAGTRSGDAIDLAMYRAAELARDAGYPYVELLGGSGRHSPVADSATLFARPSRTATPPATCPSKRPGTCYTASVAELLRRLGGIGGAQGGVPVVDHLDQYGRAVSYSGYGLGRARKFVPLPVAQAVRPATPTVAPDPAAAYAAALKKAQPVKGREPTQGWTVSD